MALPSPLSKKKTNKVSFLIYSLIGLLGIVSIIYGTYLKYRKTVLSFTEEPPVQTQIKDLSPALNPVSIKIESVGINIPVTEAKITKGVWEISETGASHLETSKRPGEGGNIVIYGHNKKKLFGSILALKKGAIIEIKNENNDTFFYVVEDKFEVDPGKIEVLFPTNTEELTLYTCSGLLDSKRMIIKAKPLSV